MLTILEMLIFIVLLGATIYTFVSVVNTKIKLIKLGKPLKRNDRKLKRIFDGFASLFFLTGSIKKERIFTGIIHSFILYGSLTFDTVTVNHILEGFIDGYHIGPVHTFIADTFAVLVLIAVTYFSVRRFILNKYTYGNKDSAVIYTFLVTVTLTFLFYEAIAVKYNNLNAEYAFLGSFLSGLFPKSDLLLHVSWWLHIVNVLLFVSYVPRSKYFHMFTGPINNGLKSYESKAKLQPLNIEDEEAESFGIEKFQDFTWKDIYDGFSCIECGRCDDYCPAVATGKALSPKNIILNLRDNLWKHKDEILSTDRDSSIALMGNVFQDEEIWACTTCSACVEVCPMKIEHVPKIIGLRQGEVLMEGKFPPSFRNFFNNVSTKGDPWGIGPEGRLDWAEGLEVPLLKDNPDVEYLLYVGCASTFDDRSKQITRALVSLLNKSGFSYAVLGKEEKCCGETARRLGEEAIGQELIRQNIDTFNSYNVKKVVTSCPHCFNTIKNEFPELGGKYEVIHHTQLLSELVENGKLKILKDITEKITVHDACYLGRGNGIYDEPRNILNSINGLDIVEHKRSKSHSFCCGAGGGMMWTEESNDKINHERVDQLSTLNPDTIATSCPYCMRMLSDGAKDKELENIKVKDIAEILNEAVE